jgi:hypothetical protein
MMRISVLVLVPIALSCGGGSQADDDGDTSTGQPTSTATSVTTTVGPSTDSSDCAPLVACGGECVDVDVDPAHCGGCDEACADGLACIGGTCGLACGPGSTACVDHCTDIQVDPANCGGCDQPCGTGVPCIAGTCTPSCDDGDIDCDGTCIDPRNDEANCGACGMTCVGEQPCVYGECVATTLHHLLITGQSLSMGAVSEVVSTTQPYSNVMFNTGVRAGGQNLTSFVPLVEQFVAGEGETIASGFANLVTETTGGATTGIRSLASAHGIGGQPYTVLRKGTAAYANGMAQVTAGAMLAAAASETYTVRAVAVIHGESDHGGGNQSYDLNLLEWQSDYEADVRALTLQTAPVPMFTDQMSSFTALGAATSTIPIQQLAAAAARPDRIFIVAPKYMLGYVADGVHLTGDGERMLGEYYAKAWHRVLVEGEPWVPLSPREVQREGAVITVDFNVPAPPLVLDTTLVTDPGAFGFAFTDTSGASPTITSVELVDEDTVSITLSAAPTGGNKRLRYAMTGNVGAAAGPTTGARGNLRDSDATPSLAGYALFNWCVHFEQAVP